MSIYSALHLCVSVSPVQNFLCDPIGIQSICYHTRANRLMNESNTTGWLEKYWTGLCVFVFTHAYVRHTEVTIEE